MAMPVVSPGHDLSLTIDYEALDTTTGFRGPMLTGTVNARLVAVLPGDVPVGLPDEVPGLDVACTNLGAGRFLAEFLGDALTDALLEPIFGETALVIYEPWVIFQAVGDGPFPVQCRYERSRVIVPR